MKKIILIITILSSNIILAQNITMAKAFYKKAQKEYENKNYKEVINLLEKTVENLNGETNPDIIYLEAKSRLESDINIRYSTALFQTFLKDADENDDRINEISEILVNITTSNNFYPNGQRKSLVQLNPDRSKNILYYNDIGINTKLEQYDKNAKLISIDYGKENNLLDGTVKREYYDESRNIESVAYYVNNKKRIRIWGNGKHIHIYDENGRFIQRYDIKQNSKFFEISNEFYSFKSFNSWKNDDYVVYFKTFNLEGGNYFKYNVSEFHKVLPINLNENQKEIIPAVVKRVDQYIQGNFNNRSYFFDINGVPTKTELYNKRGKLKKTEFYDKEIMEWKEQ
ncbi:hypothetical protein [Lacinutrix chionoecetis]